MSAMKRYSYGAALLVGLGMAQILATVQVYLSNARLYRSLLAVSDAGYLTVPNQRVMQTLPGFAPAFFGGLFFTLSVGAFITLLCLGAVRLWDRLFCRNRYATMVLIAVWAGCLLMANIRGIDLVVSAYFLCIPCAVLSIILPRMPAGPKKKWSAGIVHLVPVLILAALWLTQMDSHLFSDLRDHLLLSNRLGTEINDFYYTYTLYPAEAFRSLDQKVVKAYRMKDIQDNDIAGSIERRLLSRDYLRVQGGSPVDLTISQKHGFLVFSNGSRDILKVAPQAFLSDTGKILREFSEQSDRHHFFRQFTFFSLFMGFPVALYLFFLFLFRALAGIFLSMGASSMFASALCLALGIALFAFFVQSRVKSTRIRDVASALESERWQERVAGLKLIEKGGTEVGDFKVYRGMIKSPHIAVRYWLARSLGVSRNPETYDDLLRLLNDPHPNVVSMAFFALGKRGDTRAISIILDNIGASDHWYCQWYAYRALRRLGWKQTVLP
jgi:hypothetical protein